MTLQQKIQVNSGSRWVSLEEGRVLCCGGGGLAGAWKSVYELGGEGVGSQRADIYGTDMRAARYSHGPIRGSHGGVPTDMAVSPSQGMNRCSSSHARTSHFYIHIEIQ